jgi:hypothetical protein
LRRLHEPEAGGWGLTADQDAGGVAVIEDAACTVAGPVAVVEKLARGGIDEPVFGGHPAGGVEERPVPAVLGVADVEDARVEESAGPSGDVPAGLEIGQGQPGEDLAD